MKIAVHQPNYLPWLGYFYKMAECDKFVLLDNVQYEKNAITNRVKIKTPQGALWLTLSVKRRFPQLIKEAKMANFQPEREKHLKAIELNYKKSKHFDYLFPELKKILEKEWQYLSELNIALIKLLKTKLGIETKLEISSGYDIFGKGTELLINLCKKLNADTYLSGQGGKMGGKKYLEEDRFETAGIKLEYSDFVHPTYPQLWGDFIPGLSIIDLIFNCGPESIDILLKKNKNK